MTAPRQVPGDIEAALDAMGIEVWRSTDDEITARCPGHLERLGREDMHPTWSVNRESGLHNCYSCGFGGTFLSLVMHVLFPNDVFRAARWMRQFGVSLVKARELVPFDQIQSEGEEVDLVPETRLAMYDEAPDWALEERSLDRDSVDAYGVRWDPAHESWIIPVRLPNGDLLGWQEKWQRKRRFMNAPRSMTKSLCLFGFDAFPVGEPAVLLESPLDCVRLMTAGFLGGVSSFGAAWSRQQLELVASVTDELVSALDDDDDGRLHSEELRVGKWDRGRLLEPGWAGRLHTRFFSYGNSGKKDIGEMTDWEIEKGLREAQHSSAARFGTRQGTRDLHRRAKAVPAKDRAAYGRQGAVSADRRRRDRKDAHDDRGGRGAGRGVR